jgi:hypothetical protein
MKFNLNFSSNHQDDSARRSYIKKPAIPSATLTFHSTKLCKEFNVSKKKKIGTEVTSEAFSSISQDLKVTGLQGGPQTKPCTC